MFDGKFVATLIALVVAVIAICNFNSNKVSSKEGFAGMGHSFTTKTVREVAPSQAAYEKGCMYSVPGTYQAMLSPRFNPSQGIGANIRFNMPAHENMAVPCEPLTFGNMAKENYRENFTQENYGCGSGGCGAVSCGKGGSPKAFHGGAPVTPSDFASGNYHEVLHDISGNQSGNMEVVDSIPVGDMTTVNAMGEAVQTVVYDRLIYANQKSRLRGQGDPIRGDLPIVPCAAEWFRPSVHPNIDLQTGAMAVMGGMDNETNQQMAALIANTSADASVSGVSMASLKNMTTGSQLADLNVTAFP